MTQRDLARLLAREARRVMPADEARKFATVLRDRTSRSLPRDGLPPVTIRLTNGKRSRKDSVPAIRLRQWELPL